jgi:hypothetical protein
VVRNEASLAPNSHVTSRDGLSLEAVLNASNDKVHKLKAEATSGAGGSGTVGVAGSVAINIVDVKTLALIHADPARGLRR